MECTCLTGSSSAILPWSTSIIAAMLVMVLVTEWIGKMVSAVIAFPPRTSRLPKLFEIDRLAVVLDQNDGTGNVAGGNFPLRKSSMAESFSRDSTAWGGGPSSAVPAGMGAASEAAATTAANPGAKRRIDATLHGNICWPDRSSGTHLRYCIAAIRSRWRASLPADRSQIQS